MEMLFIQYLIVSLFIHFCHCWGVSIEDIKSLRLMQIAEELTAMGIRQDASSEDYQTDPTRLAAETDFEQPFVNRPTKRVTAGPSALGIATKDNGGLCKEHGCCAHDFVIDLAALGYTSILEPTIVNVGICYNMIGKCPKKLYEKNGMPKLRGTMCNAAKFEPITVTYLNEENERIPQPLHRMVITNCTCN